MLQRHPSIVWVAIWLMVVGLVFVGILPNLSGIGVLIGLVGPFLLASAFIGDRLQHRVERRR